jgi:hypothetical protein
VARAQPTNGVIVRGTNPAPGGALAGRRSKTRKVVLPFLLWWLCLGSQRLQAERVSEVRFAILATNATVARLAPGQLASLRAALGGGDEVALARSVTNLAGVLEGLGEAAKVPARERPALEAGYVTAWETALAVRGEVKDTEASEVILKQWSDALKRDGSMAPLQLYAARGGGQRSLLTKSLWDLLRETRDGETLHAICVLLYEDPEAADIELLVQKRDSSIPTGLRGEVQNVLNWLTYRLGPRPVMPNGRPDPGPAAAPPHW